MTLDSPLQKTVITISIMLATIMQALDTTIANVALPHMQGSLNATQEQVSWILTSYIVAAAIMTAPTGFLADRFGRKRIFAICIAGFTFASMLCGMALSLPEMVAFRLFQGIFGAALVPLSQAVLLDINPPQRHGQAMALWGVGVMVGPILGPMLGGWLTENYNWRWVFYINLPVGLAAFLGVLFFMPETKKNTDRRFDALGFILLSLALASLQLMLDRGTTKDWFSSTEIVITFTLAVLGFYLFIVHLLTTDRPFLEPAMFLNRNYATSLVFMFVMGIVLLATMALLPPYLQNLMDYPVITTGLVLAPRGIGTMTAMILAGRLIGRVDARLLILCGLLLTAFSLWEMSLFAPDMPESVIIKTGLVQGLGLGFVFIPLSTLAYRTLPNRYRNDATSIFSLMRNIGSSIGISVVFAMLAHYTQVNHAELGANILPYGPSANVLNQVALLAGYENRAVGLAWINAAVNRQAAAISYLNDFRFMAFVVLCAVPLLALIKTTQAKQDPEVVEQELTSVVE